MLVDTHVHIWDFDRASYSWLEGNTSLLNRTYSIDELEEPRLAAGVTAGILVQAANNYEDTDWMLHVASRSPWLAGVVGWLPLTDPEATAAGIVKYGSQSLFKGVRHLVHDEPDTRWLLQPQVLESLQLLAEKNITYDLVGVLPEHLRTLLELAAKVPALHIMINHLNQPPQDKKAFDEWASLMRSAAEHPLAYAKISGLGTAANKGIQWEAEDIKPAIALALEAFGVRRCCCGGDWPVSLLAGNYRYTWQQYQKVLAELLTPEEMEEVQYGTAQTFYQIN